MPKIAVKKELIFLILILVVAVFFRLWQISLIPPGLYPDVAIYGNDALESLKTGNFKVFYPENNGREGLWMWMLAFSFSIFGVSIWSIKIVAAIIGILTVLGLYLLTQELFKNSQIEDGSLSDSKKELSSFLALLASFFLAVSFWHTNFSRIGFRAILLPFILVFSFYFLLKGLNYLTKLKQTNRPVYGTIFFFILAGIIFGLGFYTYISFRMAVLILPFVFLPCWFFYKKQNLQKQFLLFTFYFLFFTFIVALPLGIYFLQNPQDFIGRATPISIFSTENPFKEFGKSLVLHLGMFNFYGDPNWRHNFSGSPQLSWPLGILFLIGLIYSIYNLVKRKNVPCYLLLVVWFIVMLLPGILTYEGIPHALRVIGVIPVVYIFAALGGYFIYNWLSKNAKSKILLCLAVFLFLTTIGILEFNKYFTLWAKNPHAQGAFTKNFAEIGYYLNSLPPETQKYVIVNEPGVPVPYPNGLPMPAQTPMFIEKTKYGEIQSVYLLPENLDQIKFLFRNFSNSEINNIIEKNTVIVPMSADPDIFRELSLKFPQGITKKINEIVIYETSLSGN